VSAESARRTFVAVNSSNFAFTRWNTILCKAFFSRHGGANQFPPTAGSR